MSEKKLTELLKNLVRSQEYVNSALIYSLSGDLKAKYGQKGAENLDISPIEGPLVRLLERINHEARRGTYGSGTVDTSEFIIAYFEAGKEAILFLICDFYINLDELIPITYLVAEKVTQILEGSFDLAHNSLKIPDLKFQPDFSLNLDKFSPTSKETLLDDGQQHYFIKRAEKNKYMFKVIILGDEAVGKTTLISSFISKKQTTDYRPTIGISISTKNYYVQGFKENEISFLLYDLAGQKFFKRVRRDYYQGANCALIVFDVTRKDTLQNAIEGWYRDARDALGEIPFFLIANKIDLEDKREVSETEGLEAANQIKSFYIETSALENENVRDMFNMVGIRLYFNKYPR